MEFEKQPKLEDVKNRAAYGNIDLVTSEYEVSGLKTYNNGELEFKPYLVLQSTENINDYVLALVKNYFRTTYKNGVTTDSMLSEHGLDSLDAVELAMQIEEDLGYDIATETLANFHRVGHFANYIAQVEQFKMTKERMPLT